MSWDVDTAAKILLACVDGRQSRGPLSDEWPDFDEATAYAVQDRALDLRLERGETLIGVKLGVTSRAKQRQVGVSSPNVAWLTDAMLLPAGVPVPLDDLIAPRAEPEIAFQLASPLAGPGVHAARAMAAVGQVYAAMEVIDSRYTGYKFTLPDVTADNASSGLLVLGPIAASPLGLDLGLEACLLTVDGDVVDSATGAAVLGHPGEALAFAANALARRGRRLEAGWLVLTGGMTDAVPLAPGRTVGAAFTSLGSVTVRA